MPLPTSYGDVWAYLLRNTENIGESQPADGFPPARTALGRHVMEVCQQGFIFGGTYEEMCCPEAEWKLASTMSSASVQSQYYRSPIIVTHQKTPVGIIKDYGENTCYGLVTSRTLGLVEGAFSVPKFTFDFQDIPKATHAWQVPVNAIHGFENIRFGIFMVPRRAQRKLYVDNIEIPAMKTTHDALKLQAARLLIDAKPLTALSDQTTAGKLLAAAVSAG